MDVQLRDAPDASERLIWKGSDRDPAGAARASPPAPLYEDGWNHALADDVDLTEEIAETPFAHVPRPPDARGDSAVSGPAGSRLAVSGRGPDSGPFEETWVAGLQIVGCAQDELADPIDDARLPLGSRRKLS
jgi:hypothetical protein